MSKACGLHGVRVTGQLVRAYRSALGYRFLLRFLVWGVNGIPLWTASGVGFSCNYGVRGLEVQADLDRGSVIRLAPIDPITLNLQSQLASIDVGRISIGIFGPLQHYIPEHSPRQLSMCPGP